MNDVKGKRVLVVGLGRSGYSVALLLRRHGAVVTVTDIKPPAAFAPLLPELLAQKVGLELGSQRAESFLSSDLVVVSPGVPWDLPQLQATRERGVPVLPEIEAASWYLTGPIVGITGSNGKTTTTTLLGKMLEASGLPIFVGGNIGVALSSGVDAITRDSIVVSELSSFQLEAIRDFRPRVAVMLNLSPNHLDRHPSFEAYAQAKRQIFRNQRAEDYAILNADDAWVCGLGPALAARKVFFSRFQQLPCGVFVSNGDVVYRMGNLERVLLKTRDVHLPGAFNLEDVLAASAAACVLGADFDAIQSAVQEFKGVEHRLEYVRSISGVKFYNNSKATSVDATVKSLEAFEHGVHLIMGGKDKGAPYAPLLPLLKNRVREILLIGAAADRIAQELSGAVKLIQSGNLENAVLTAFQNAAAGDVVLLAPACSSFDQFQDFEHRGRVFKELVERLAEEVKAGLVRPEWEPEPPAATESPETLALARAPEPEAPVSLREALPELLPEEGAETESLIREDAEADEQPLGTPLVYELSAQELPPAEVEPVQEPSTGPETSQPRAPGALEEAYDVKLPYEARTDEKGAEAGGAKKEKTKPKSAAPDSPQPRLPGMD